MAQTPDRIGEYEILEPLPSGRVGDVYKARDPQGGRLVAIKLLKHEYMDQEQSVERFKREIRSAIQLEHPSIVHTFAAGSHDGRLYYVMEYVDGRTISQDLLRKHRYDEQRALAVTIKAAEALEYVRSYGLIHRDIKPENIMVTDDGEVKVLDLGLAKSTESNSRLTMVGTVLGTPNYMSPEQAQEEADVDHRSDIYGLGATLFHMLTAHPPFEGSNPVEVVTNVVYQEAPSPLEYNPSVSDSVCCVLARLLAKSPGDRYQTYPELIEDLRRAAAGETTAAESSGTIRLVSPTPAKNRTYRFSHIPLERDLLFGKAALRNKLTDRETLGRALDVQEKAAHHGTILDLGAVMVIEGMLPPAKLGLIEQARATFELEQSRNMFLRAAFDHKLIDARQMAEARKTVQETGEQLVNVLLESGAIDERARSIAMCHQKQARRATEDRFIVKVALENKFLTANQASKCTLIQQNGLIMGEYCDLGRILVEKGFLLLRHKEVILRAIRRSFLTAGSIRALIEQQVIA